MDFSIKQHIFTPDEIKAGLVKRQSAIDSSKIRVGDLVNVYGITLQVKDFITKFSDSQGLGVQFTDNTNINLDYFVNE